MTKFNHPDKKLEKISRYYIDLYDKKVKNYAHRLVFLASIAPSYLTISNSFSFDDDRYVLYPNRGWLEKDYERVLELNLENKEDLKEFRLIGANLARVIKYKPSKIVEIKDFPHFEAILEFILIEGLYDYFSITSEELIMNCIKYNLIKSGDSGAIAMSKALIYKDWYGSLTKIEKVKYHVTKKYISIIGQKN